MDDRSDDDRTAPRPPRRSTRPQGSARTLGAPTSQPGGAVVVLVPTSDPTATDAPVLPPVDGSSTTGNQYRHLSYQALLADAGLHRKVARRRRRPGAWRILAAAVALSSLVIGAVLLKDRVFDRSWVGEVAPQAAAVERQRGLGFDHALEVALLPVDQYAQALAEHVLGEFAPDVGRDASGAVALDQVAAEWRALGLLEGPLDPLVVGRFAAEVRTAFYDADADRIVMLSGLSGVTQSLALSREMTLALTDQHFGWHARLATVDASTRVGTIALFDADALDTASVVTGFPVARVIDQTALVATDVAPGLTYAFDLVVGRTATMMAPRFAETTLRSFPVRDDLLAAPVRGDASVVVTGHPTADVAPTFDTAFGHSLGMVAWYYALASRLPADDAWNAAQAWSGDAVRHIDRSGVRCVEAHVWAHDAGSTAVLLDAFDRWAADAPAAALTEVEPFAAGFGVVVRSCDPGVDADTVTTAAIEPIG